MDLKAEYFDTEEETWGGLDPVDLPLRPLPHLPQLENGGFHVVIKPEVMDHIHRHGSSITDREVCGILVGDVYRDDDGIYLYVEAMIEGKRASEAAAQVTFTADTWSDIQRTMDAQYPNSRIVGWYHTHPNFGIFLSEMDLFIHRNFFNLPWQVAMVFDPIRREEGIFIWKDGAAVRGGFLLDQPAPAAPAAMNSQAASQIVKPIEPKIGVSGTAPAADSSEWGWGSTIAVAGILFVASGVAFLAATTNYWQLVRDWLKSLLPH